MYNFFFFFRWWWSRLAPALIHCQCRMMRLENRSHTITATNLSAIILVSVPLTVSEMILPTSALYHSECVVIKNATDWIKFLFNFQTFSLLTRWTKTASCIYTDNICSNTLKTWNIFFFVGRMYHSCTWNTLCLEFNFVIALTTNLVVLKCL